MRITVNGEERECDDDVTVGRLVDEVAHSDRRGVAAAVNGEVVPRGELDTTRLHPGDRVEVVAAVQGG